MRPKGCKYIDANKRVIHKWIIQKNRALILSERKLLPLWVWIVGSSWGHGRHFHKHPPRRRHRDEKNSKWAAPLGAGKRIGLEAAITYSASSRARQEVRRMVVPGESPSQMVFVHIHKKQHLTHHSKKVSVADLPSLESNDCKLNSRSASY